MRGARKFERQTRAANRQHWKGDKDFFHKFKLYYHNSSLIIELFVLFLKLYNDGSRFTAIFDKTFLLFRLHRFGWRPRWPHSRLSKSSLAKSILQTA